MVPVVGDEADIVGDASALAATVYGAWDLVVVSGWLAVDTAVVVRVFVFGIAGFRVFTFFPAALGRRNKESESHQTECPRLGESQGASRRAIPTGDRNCYAT